MTKPKAVWTSADDVQIRRHYKSNMTDTEIEALFPGKSISQISSRAYNLGVRRGRQIGTGSRGENLTRDPDPIDREGDARYVSACLSQGGFPHVRMIEGRTVWVWPVGRMAA